MDADEWVENHGSGTLRKNKKIGFAWKNQYIHERLCYEFGYLFEHLPKTQVSFNDAISAADCKPLTEAGWFIERYQNLKVFPEDYYEAKYIHIEEREGKRREGVGIIVRKTSAPWIPKGSVVFAIIAEHSKTLGDYRDARNPF